MSGFEHFLLHVLIQLVVLLVAARIGGWVMGLLGQPQVVGEIVAGLVLGPSLLGRFAPDAVAFIFPPEAALVFRVLSELGLLLLMFLIGLEFDFSHLSHVGRTAASVAAAGILLPFGMGAALAWWMHPLVAAEMNHNGFILIVAVALSAPDRGPAAAAGRTSSINHGSAPGAAQDFQLPPRQGAEASFRQ
jgi:Kef-type K+ transport system membrane component KefB